MVREAQARPARPAGELGNPRGSPKLQTSSSNRSAGPLLIPCPAAHLTTELFSPSWRWALPDQGLGLLRQAQVSPSVHRKPRTPSSLPRLSCMSPYGGGVSVRRMAGVHQLSFCSHGQTAPSFQAPQLVLAPGSSSSPPSLCNSPSRDPFCTLLPCFYVLFSKSLSLPPQHTPDPTSPRTAAPLSGQFQTSHLPSPAITPAITHAHALWYHGSKKMPAPRMNSHLWT